MIKFDISKNVPKFIMNDKNGYALAMAIEAGLNKMNSIIKRSMDMMENIDSMPEWFLDELAWEMNCLYDYAADVEIKRNFIRNATSNYKILGTPEAVNKSIKAAFNDGEVVEWFEYDGNPYRYRIKTTHSINKEKIDYLVNLLKPVVNVRSEYDGLIAERDFGTATSYIGCVIVKHKKINLTDGNDNLWYVDYYTNDFDDYYTDEKGNILARLNSYRFTDENDNPLTDEEDNVLYEENGGYTWEI